LESGLSPLKENPPEKININGGESLEGLDRGIGRGR
jgi:hypothetical protein